MREIPIGPDMTAEPIPFTEEQLRAIYARIRLIDRHFDGCCAFQQEGCHYGDEYDELHGRLHLAGLPEHQDIAGSEDFEEWLAEWRLT